MAIPMAAVTQSPAAVVSPLTCRLSVTMIVPAPRKPIPHKSCAGILPMSAGYEAISERYIPVTVARAEPRHTRAKVLIPAAYLLLALSTPTRLPSTIASKSRRATENAVISLKKYILFITSPLSCYFDFCKRRIQGFSADHPYAPHLVPVCGVRLHILRVDIVQVFRAGGGENF